MKKQVEVTIRPYLVGGPQVFIAAKPGPYSDEELVAAIAKVFPKIRFFVAARSIHGMKGEERMIIFEESIEQAKFEFCKEGESFKAMFRAGNLGKQCQLCLENHRTYDCGQAASLPSFAAVKEQLVIKPKLLN